MDINNLRLEEEFGAGSSKTKSTSSAEKPGKSAPLSLISGVKKPLGHTNSFSGSTLPKHGVEPLLEHEPELSKVT